MASVPRPQSAVTDFSGSGNDARLSFVDDVGVDGARRGGSDVAGIVEMAALGEENFAGFHRPRRLSIDHQYDGSFDEVAEILAGMAVSRRSCSGWDLDRGGYAFQLGAGNRPALQLVKLR